MQLLLQAASTAVSAALAINQTGIISAANAAAFATSNASAIVAAKAADNATVSCKTISAKAYASAITNLLAANQTEALATGIAAAFAQGCEVSSETALVLVNALATANTTSNAAVGPALFSKFQLHPWCTINVCLHLHLMLCMLLLIVCSYTHKVSTY